MVDDTEANRYVAARWLERAGFRVATAATGAEALALAASDVELVLLDVHLPDLHGFEVARKLKGDPATSHIPVLHISGERVSAADRVTGLEAGADGYLVQPVDPDELVASVRALLRLSATERALRQQTRALTESEARFRAVSDRSPHGVVLVRAERDGDAAQGPIREFRYRYANAAAGRIVSRAPAALVGRGVAELFPATRVNGLFQGYVGVAETGTPFESDLLYQADGLDHGFHVTAIAVGDDVAITFADVSDRLRAVAERERLLETIKGERSQLAQVFRQSPSFLAVLRGPDNVFELVNEAYEQIIGHGRDVIGKPLFDAIPEARGQGFDAYLAGVRDSGEALVFREQSVMLERTPGAPLEERFIDITYLPLLEPDGTRDAVIAHGTDVTARVHARRDAERLLADTEQARIALSLANEQLQDQQVELELTNQTLQDNAVELEAQAEELQATAAHLEEQTEQAELARRTVSAIVEAVTDGFVAFDGEMRYTYVNARAAEMWRLSPAQMIGRAPHELWPHMGHSPVLEMSRRVLATGISETSEAYAPTLGVRIEARIYPAVGGGVVIFFTDVTERRRAEAAAAFLSEASRVLASSADYQSTLSNLARAAVPALGDWCAVDVIAEPDGGHWPPTIERVAVVHEDPAKVALAANLTRAFPVDWSRDTGTPGVIRTRRPMFFAEVTDAMIVAGAQNEVHLGMLRALAIRSIMIVPLVARERVLGALTLVMAESERRFTESDLAVAVELGQRAGVALDNARLLRDAANANAAKTEFLRTISHELRQPLNAIRGYLDLWTLGLRGDLTPAMRDDVARLGRNQEHLGTLIEDLLSFTRLDAGRLNVEHVPVPIAPIIDSLEAMVRPQMTARRLEFAHERGEPRLAALGDADRIVQVCLNLLTNAMRATPAGGRVALTCTSDARTVSIAIADTGVGIPADKLEAIFDPFTQLGRALNAPKEGAGLGLAISRGLSEAMDGTLTVESVPGEGSTFTLSLPRAVAQGDGD